ncbi:MAG: hypothetical protein SPL58_08965 [Bacteroidaceae bacterium]|nr:hypothetical protein [Bacteroidaceae bacterium]
MNKEEYEKHKPFAGEKKPSMLRRRVGHDYESRRMYLITMTVEGRRSLLGRLAGRSDAPEGSADWPHVELSELGEKVRERWYATEQIYPEIKVVALQIMPDHLHGILFVRERMAQHLGKVIKGFKAGCNKAYRELVLGLPANGAATRLQQRHPSSSSLQSVCYAATTLQPPTQVNTPNLRMTAPTATSGLVATTTTSFLAKTNSSGGSTISAPTLCALPSSVNTPTFSASASALPLQDRPMLP